MLAWIESLFAKSLDRYLAARHAPADMTLLDEIFGVDKSEQNG